MLKLNMGCGPCLAPGWINLDTVACKGLDVRGDLRAGLPLAADSVDCIAGIHLLQDLAWPEFGPALRELRRVLKPGGTLRLALPDLDKAIRAYLEGDAGYFYVSDRDAVSLGAKLVTQIIWYGSVRTPVNFEFMREWLAQSGFRDIRRCGFRSTASPHAELATLDNRERESLFIEAVK
jgi:predicted SAM-dependent methyltransferase